VTQEQPEIVSLPVLVLKDLVLFPHCVMRFRPSEMPASQRELLERAAENNEQLFIVKSRTGVVDMPQRTDLPRVGVIATAGPKLTMGDRTAIPVTGKRRAELLDLQESQGEIKVSIRLIPQVVANDEALLDASQAMMPWTEYQSACVDAGFHAPFMQTCEPGTDFHNAAIMCDVMANGAQFRFETENEIKFIDVQPLLDEPDPLARLRLFGEIFRAELTRLQSDPEFSRRVEVERERQRLEQEKRERERAEMLDQLRTVAAQSQQISTVPSAGSEILELPLLPLRDIVIYPSMESSFVVGRGSSIKAVRQASTADNLILLFAQRDGQIDLPLPSDIYQTGVVASILENRLLPDDSLKVTVRGLRTATVLEISNAEGWFHARVSAASLVEYPEELTSALASTFDLLRASDITIQDRQELLEGWDNNDPRCWIRKCLPAMEKVS
jgi:ATP-dependent Lon protease